MYANNFNVICAHCTREEKLAKEISCSKHSVKWRTKQAHSVNKQMQQWFVFQWLIMMVIKWRFWCSATFTIFKITLNRLLLWIL